jgi:predicted lipoprotein with Yx(FWY)xxD motif
MQPHQSFTVLNHPSLYRVVHGVTKGDPEMTRYVKLAALSVGAALVLSSCGGSSSNNNASSNGSQPTTKQSTPTSTAALHVGHTSLGKVLVDSHGLTVYLLTSDKPNKSLCSAQCLAYWPPVAAPKPGAKLPGVTAKVGSTKSTAGSAMATAAGWPLYTFVQDKSPGDVTGEGMATFGGVWYAVSPSGHAVKSASSGGSSPSSSSGGGGAY